MKIFEDVSHQFKIERDCCNYEKDFKKYTGSIINKSNYNQLFSCIHCGQIWQKIEKYFRKITINIDNFDIENIKNLDGVIKTDE